MSVMATMEEVPVSVEQVVMVDPEGEGEPLNDCTKAQVILQLQPISTGYVLKQYNRDQDISNLQHIVTVKELVSKIFS